MVSIEKAVVYYRVSTDRQGRSRLGLDAQHESVDRYIKAKNITLLKEMTEIERGRKKDRPVLKEALAYCKKYGAILLIAKLDRLGRSVSLISALMESDVKFIAVDNPNASRLLLHIMAAIAEYESQLISTRTKEALQAAKKNGKVLGINGIALSKKNKADAKRFAEKMRPVIGNMQQNGFKTIRQIVDELNRRNIPTFRGKANRWHVATVHNVITVIQ